MWSGRSPSGFLSTPFLSFSPFCQRVCGVFFRVILGLFWEPFGVLLRLFTHPKNGLFLLMHVGGAFWKDFGSPDPRKLSFRVSEALILTKSPFSPKGRFSLQNGPNIG